MKILSTVLFFFLFQFAATINRNKWFPPRCRNGVYDVSNENLAEVVKCIADYGIEGVEAASDDKDPNCGYFCIVEALGLVTNGNFTESAVVSWFGATMPEKYKELTIKTTKDCFAKNGSPTIVNKRNENCIEIKNTYICIRKIKSQQKCTPGID